MTTCVPILEGSSLPGDFEVWKLLDCSSVPGCPLPRRTKSREGVLNRPKGTKIDRHDAAGEGEVPTATYRRKRLRLGAEHLPTPVARPRAIRIYQDGMQRFLLSYEIVDRLSEQFRQDGKYDTAIEVLQTARKVSVLSFAVAKLLISVYRECGRHSEALNEALRLTVSHNSQWETYQVMWNVLQGQNMTPRERLNTWISLSTRDSPRWEVFVYLAYCYLDLQDYKLAVQAAHLCRLGLLQRALFAQFRWR